MQIVDTHQHLWDLDLFSYSWLDSLPALNRSFRMSDYLAAAKGLNVVRSVHLEADVDEPFMLDETRHLLALADQPDNPLEGIVACGRPESQDFKSYLDKIAGHPKLKGIRRVLHTQPDEVGQGATFINNVAALADYGLSFDVCVLARQLPIAIKLVSECPDVFLSLTTVACRKSRKRISIHGALTSRKSPHFQMSLAKSPASWLTPIPRNGVWKTWRPFVEHAMASFGWDRVLFGSDWPVCMLSASYQQWVKALQEITQGAPEARQRTLFYDNAVRVYRLS